MDKFTHRDYQRAQFCAKYVALRGWEFDSLDDKKFDEAVSFILSSRSAEDRFWRRLEEDKEDAFIEEIENGVTESDTIILNWSSSELFKLSGLAKLADSSKQSGQIKNFWCIRANRFQGRQAKDGDGKWARVLKENNGLSLSVAMILKAFDNSIGGIEKYKRRALPKELTNKFAELELKVSKKKNEPKMWVEGPAAGLGESRDWVKKKRSYHVAYGASHCNEIESLPVSRKSS
jgi:hypothetical protein